LERVRNPNTSRPILLLDRRVSKSRKPLLSLQLREMMRAQKIKLRHEEEIFTKKEMFLLKRRSLHSRELSLPRKLRLQNSLKPRRQLQLLDLQLQKSLQKLKNQLLFPKSPNRERRRLEQLYQRKRPHLLLMFQLKEPRLQGRTPSLEKKLQLKKLNLLQFSRPNKKIKKLNIINLLNKK